MRSRAEVSPPGNTSAPQRIQTKCRNCVCIFLSTSFPVLNTFSPRITKLCCGILLPFCHEVVIWIGVTESGFSCFLILALSGLALVLSALYAIICTEMSSLLTSVLFTELVVSLGTLRIRQMKLICSSLGVFRCQKWEKGTRSLGSLSHSIVSSLLPAHSCHRQCRKRQLP